MTSTDPTASESYWAPLSTLQRQMDEDIARLYEQRGVEGVRPRFAYPLIRLAHTGPLTIKDLAESLGQTHSAVSQTVSALRAEGLVQTLTGPDARTRLVELTERATALVPFLEAEWRATEAAAAELDAALPVSLAAFTDGLHAQLAAVPFLERILRHLPADARPHGGRPRSSSPGTGTEASANASPTRPKSP